MARMLIIATFIAIALACAAQTAGPKAIEPKDLNMQYRRDLPRDTSRHTLRHPMLWRERGEPTDEQISSDSAAAPSTSGKPDVLVFPGRGDGDVVSLDGNQEGWHVVQYPGGEVGVAPGAEPTSPRYQANVFHPVYHSDVYGLQGPPRQAPYYYRLHRGLKDKESVERVPFRYERRKTAPPFNQPQKK